MEPTVSVIVPFCNRYDLLRNAVDSVLAQTFQDFEIILVDDGSTEVKEDIFSHNDSRIKFFKQPNRGAAAARNTGIKQSLGRYIAFLDSDDLFLPNKLEVQVQFMESHPERIFSHTSYCTFTACSNEETEVDSGKFSGWVYPNILFNCPIATPTVMVRREIFDTIGFEEKYRLGEDIILWSTIAKKHYLYGIEQPLTKVRLTDSSASNSRYKQIVGNYNIRSYFYRRDRQLGVKFLLISFLTLSYILVPGFFKVLLARLSGKGISG